MITQFVREIFLVDDLIITIEVHYQKCYHLGLLKKGYAIRDVAKLKVLPQETSIKPSRTTQRNFLQAIISSWMQKRSVNWWKISTGSILMIVEHIAYNRTEQQYDASIFTKEKNRQPVEKAYEAKKHILDYVFTDSKGERKFAEALDKADEVCVYARLPRTFQIPTPVGKYAPDWAIAFNDNMGVKHIFFVAETKGSMLSMNLKGAEMAKIECAKKLFNNVSTSKVRYHEITDYDTMLNVINSLG